MINRSIARVRVLQQLYRSIESNHLNPVQAEQQLGDSLQYSYHLYYYLLDLVRAIATYQEQLLEIRSRSFLASEEGQHGVGHRLSDMHLVKLIARCSDLQSTLDIRSLRWEIDDTLLRRLYRIIEQQKTYEDLPADLVGMPLDAQCRFWISILKLLFKDAHLNDHLEAVSFFWDNSTAICEKVEVEEMPDVEQLDQAVEDLKGSAAYQATPLVSSPVGTIKDFVIKTLKRWAKAESVSLPEDLLPMYHNEDDRRFAQRLLHQVLINREEYDALLAPRLQNWDQDRVALIDTIILEMAVAEALTFSDISLVVTINEYIELAKTFSTSKSGAFVNGVLDRLFSDMKQEGKLLKS